MSFHQRLTTRAKALVEKKGEALAFLQWFTRELLNRLEWPEQHARTVFSFAEPGAKVSCTLWLSLHLPDGVADKVSITLKATPLKHHHIAGVFELHVADLHGFHVCSQDHSKGIESCREVWPEIEQHISSLFDKEILA